MDSNTLFSIRLSAPGKVILFGEYSVVFKKPAIAATVSLRTQLYLRKTYSDSIELNFSAIGLKKTFSAKVLYEYFMSAPSTNSMDGYVQHLNKAATCLLDNESDSLEETHAQKFALTAFLHCFGKFFHTLEGFCLQINTELPVGSGVGSSASFSVVLAAAALLYGHHTEHKKVSDLIEKKSDGEIIILEKFKNNIAELAFSCEKIFHGTPSGVDHNTILRGSLLEFIKSDDNNNKMNYIGTDTLKILLVNTNVPRSTKKLVAKVKQLKDNHPEIINCVLDAMEYVAKSAVKDLINFKENTSDLKGIETHFGDLISLNHNLLRVLGTSHPTLEQIVSTANKYNLKAKLTGGGGGGFGFIYLPNDVEFSVIKNVEKELTEAGFTVYDVSLGGPGLIIEELRL